MEASITQIYKDKSAIEICQILCPDCEWMTRKTISPYDFQPMYEVLADGEVITFVPYHLVEVDLLSDTYDAKVDDATSELMREIVIAQVTRKMGQLNKIAGSGIVYECGK